MAEGKKFDPAVIRNLIASKVKEMPVPQQSAKKEDEDPWEIVTETLSKIALTLSSLDKRLMELERNWSAWKEEKECAPEINTLLEDNGNAA